MNSRLKIQSKHSAKPLTPSPSPLKRGEGSKRKDVGKPMGFLANPAGLPSRWLGQIIHSLARRACKEIIPGRVLSKFPSLNQLLSTWAQSSKLMNDCSFLSLVCLFALFVEVFELFRAVSSFSKFALSFSSGHLNFFLVHGWVSGLGKSFRLSSKNSNEIC